MPGTSSTAHQVQQQRELVQQQDLKLEALGVGQDAQTQLSRNQQTRHSKISAAAEAMAEVSQSSELMFLHQCSEQTAVHAHQALLDSIYATGGKDMEAIAVRVSLRQLSGLLMAHPFSVVSAAMHQGMDTNLKDAS